MEFLQRGGFPNSLLLPLSFKKSAFRVIASGEKKKTTHSLSRCRKLEEDGRKVVISPMVTLFVISSCTRCSSGSYVTLHKLPNISNSRWQDQCISFRLHLLVEYGASGSFQNTKRVLSVAKVSRSDVECSTSGTRENNSVPRRRMLNMNVWHLCSSFPFS